MLVVGEGTDLVVHVGNFLVLSPNFKRATSHFLVHNFNYDNLEEVRS